MEYRVLKRTRSEDEENASGLQNKIWVNEKLVNKNDENKMKEIHEKTTKLLFNGAAAAAASATADKNNNNADTENGKNANISGSGAASTKTRPKLCEQYYLLGDGTIMLRDLRQDQENPHLEGRKSLCCQRQTLIHDTCTNCTMDLCEECGYSCNECFNFICRSCVTLFGNYPAGIQDTFCERCQMFCS